MHRTVGAAEPVVTSGRRWLRTLSYPPATTRESPFVEDNFATHY